MKEMLVTLGNEAGVSPSEHFERLAQCGAIRSFEFCDGLALLTTAKYCGNILP